MIVFSLILGLIFGSVFYFWDRKKGLNAYRSWYNLTHKEPLPDSEKPTKGFVFRQTLKEKINISILISLVVFLVLQLFTTGPILKDALYLPLILIGALSSFYLMPSLDNNYIKSIGNLIDKIDKKEQNLMDEVKTEKPIQEQVKENPNSVNSTNKKEQSEADEPNNEDKNSDWRKGIDDFLKK